MSGITPLEGLPADSEDQQHRNLGQCDCSSGFSWDLGIPTNQGEEDGWNHWLVPL